MNSKKFKLKFFSPLIIFLLAFYCLNIAFYQRTYAEENDKSILRGGYRSTDVNGDTKIDDLDIEEVENNYGTKNGDAAWQYKYDINLSGIVDVFDIVLVARDYGKSITLPAPTNLTAAPVSSSQIKLEWSPVQGAVSYNIYRATSYDGAYNSVSSTTFTAFTDGGLSPSTTYYYRVVSVNDSGEGLKGSPVSATTYAATPKPNPPKFQAESITPYGVTTFFRPQTLETIPPTGYRFYTGNSINGPWVLQYEGNGYTNRITTTFPVGSTQYIKFTAMYYNTESDPDGPYYLAVLPRPTGIRYYTHGEVGQIGSYGWIDLRWGAVAGAAKYEVYYRPLYDYNADFTYAGTVTSPQISIYNIPYYESYKYLIVPINSDGVEGSLYGEINASILGESGS